MNKVETALATGLVTVAGTIAVLGETGNINSSVLRGPAATQAAASQTATTELLVPAGVVEATPELLSCQAAYDRVKSPKGPGPGVSVIIGYDTLLHKCKATCKNADADQEWDCPAVLEPSSDQ